jgi:predicted ATPase
MRITSIKASNVLPVKKFEVDELSDTIVIAGPNGVGKSRLIQNVLAHIQNLAVSPNMSLIIEATDKKGNRCLGTKRNKYLQSY